MGQQTKEKNRKSSPTKDQGANQHLRHHQRSHHTAARDREVLHRTKALHQAAQTTKCQGKGRGRWWYHHQRALVPNEKQEESQPEESTRHAKAGTQKGNNRELTKPPSTSTRSRKKNQGQIKVQSSKCVTDYKRVDGGI